MKKAILFIFTCIVVIMSCSDDIDHKINGQWQLKTIDENGVISRVDTVFYSFQRGAVFSFNSLIDDRRTSISYGYVDFPSDNEVFVSMDTTRNSANDFINIAGDFLTLSGWNKLYNLFTVESIDGKNMVLSSEGKIYSFKKY